jgi:DNA topoisomerase-2
MSDSESDGFRIADDSGSDDFVVAPKAKKAAPAKKVVASGSKATKVCVSLNLAHSREKLISAQAPAAKKAPAKKQPLASKKNAPNDSISEADDTDFDKSPAKPKAKSKAAEMDIDEDDENVPVAKGSTKQKSASEMYQKVCAICSYLGIEDVC